jgi:hypothetical protein
MKKTTGNAKRGRREYAAPFVTGTMEREGEKSWLLRM